MEKFSRDLAAEVRPLGVTIQTVHPGYVLTKMAPINEKSIIAPTSDSFVTATLRTLGLEDRTSGYWSHKIQACNNNICFVYMRFNILVLIFF